jgi:hypothetical protein
LRLRLLSWSPSGAARQFRREGAGIPGLEVFGDEGCVLAESIAGALDLDDLGVVEQAIEQGGGDDLVAEDVAPFAEAAVGGEDHGAALVAGVDELEEQVGAAGGDRQVADLVDDEESIAGNEADALLELSFALGLGQGGDDVGKGAEVNALAGLDGLDAERRGEMGLAGSRRDSVILPGVRRSRSWSLTRFTRVAVSWSS